MSWDGLFDSKSNMSKRAKQPNHNNGGNYCGQFKSTNTRDPSIPKEADIYTIPTALHHVTDWALLRDVWNRMVLDKHWGTICCWLYAVGFDVNNVYKEQGEKDRVQSPAAIVGAIMRKEEVQLVADVSEIHERITWSTWNLVEGPKEDIRSDDLGNFHDIFSNVNGLTQTERARLQQTDVVYTIMSGLNLKKEVAKLKALELSKALLAVDRNATIIKLRSTMWTKAPTGAKKCWSKNVVH